MKNYLNSYFNFGLFFFITISSLILFFLFFVNISHSQTARLNVIDDLSGNKQKFVWAQCILRYVEDDKNVKVTGRWDTQTKTGFWNFQLDSNIVQKGRGGQWTPKTTNALEQVGLEWILDEQINNKLGRKNNNLRNAIKEFQRTYSLDVDGKVGPQVRREMIKVILGLRPSATYNRHFKLGELSFTPTLEAGPLGGPVTGKIYTEFDDPVITFVVENAEREAFKKFRSKGLPVKEDESIKHELMSQPWVGTYGQICLLIIQFRHPENGRVGFAPATGFLIGPRHVATAAHITKNVVRDKDTDKDILLTAERIFVVPGFTFPKRVEVCKNRNKKSCVPTKRPYGWVMIDSRAYNPHPLYFERAKLFAPDGTVDKFLITRTNFDYAVLDLGTEMGNHTVFIKGSSDKIVLKKKLGWWGKSGHNTSIRPFKKTVNLINRDLFVIGYPHIFSGRQTYSYGTVDFSELFTAGSFLGELAQDTGPNEFVHTAHTFPGHSGAPIWEQPRREGQKTMRLLGIDVTTINKDALPSIFNQEHELQIGVAWNKSVVNDINKWKSKPNWNKKK